MSMDDLDKEFDRTEVLMRRAAQDQDTFFDAARWLLERAVETGDDDTHGYIALLHLAHGLSLKGGEYFDGLVA